MAAFSFANKIMRGEQLKIFRAPDGSELERDFTYVDDIVQGTVAAVDRIGPSRKPAPLRVYNLGNRQPQNVSYLVDVLEKLLGKKAVRVYATLPATGDVLRTHANISLASIELGYKPTISLQQGLTRFIDWYKSHYRYGLDSEMMSYKPL